MQKVTVVQLLTQWYDLPVSNFNRKWKEIHTTKDIGCGMSVTTLLNKVNYKKVSKPIQLHTKYLLINSGTFESDCSNKPNALWIA